MLYSMSRNSVHVTGFGTVRAALMAGGLRAAFGPAAAVRVGEQGLAIRCGTARR